MSYTLQAENFKSRIYTDIDVSSIFFIKQRAQLFPGTSLPLSGGCSNTSSNSEERAEAPALCVSVKSPRTERARAPGSAADDN